MLLWILAGVDLKSTLAGVDLQSAGVDLQSAGVDLQSTPSEPGIYNPNSETQLLWIYNPHLLVRIFNPHPLSQGFKIPT